MLCVSCLGADASPGVLVREEKGQQWRESLRPDSVQMRCAAHSWAQLCCSCSCRMMDGWMVLVTFLGDLLEVEKVLPCSCCSPLAWLELTLKRCGNDTRCAVCIWSVHCPLCLCCLCALQCTTDHHFFTNTSITS